MSRQNIRILLNILLPLLVFWSWGRMFRGVEGGLLSSAGMRSLRYFTVLSNLLEAFVSLLFLSALLTGSGQALCVRLKFTAAVCVGLTFFTVIFFLGPLYGYPPMYKGSNLWLHLIVPLLAMAEFVFLNDIPMRYQENLISLLPMLVYGVFYIANVLVNGRGEGPSLNDFYGFFLWGLPAALFILCVIILATFGIGAGLRLLNSLWLKHTGLPG